MIQVTLGPEAVTAIQEVGPVRAVVDRFEDHAQHLLDDLVRRGRDTERSQFAVGLGDIGPSGRLELEALMPEALAQVVDGLEGEAVQGLPVASRSHVSGFGLDPLVGHLVQLGAVEEAVEVEVHPTSVRVVTS
jgi:hypothetical protein